jgi:hypothetical protein
MYPTSATRLFGCLCACACVCFGRVSAFAALCPLCCHPWVGVDRPLMTLVATAMQSLAALCLRYVVRAPMRLCVHVPVLPRMVLCPWPCCSCCHAFTGHLPCLGTVFMLFFGFPTRLRVCTFPCVVHDVCGMYVCVRLHVCVRVYAVLPRPLRHRGQRD